MIKIMNGEVQQTQAQTTSAQAAVSASKAGVKTGKIIATAVVITVVGFILGWLTCGWLFNWVYTKLEPTDIWKIPNFGLTILGDFVVALIMVWVYALIMKGIPGQGVKKGINYGLIMWALSLGGMWATLMFMTVNPGVVLYWTLSGLVIFLIKGTIIGAMVKS